MAIPSTLPKYETTRVSRSRHSFYIIMIFVLGFLPAHSFRSTLGSLIYRTQEAIKSPEAFLNRIATPSTRDFPQDPMLMKVENFLESSPYKNVQYSNEFLKLVSNEIFIGFVTRLGLWTENASPIHLVSSKEPLEDRCSILYRDAEVSIVSC